MQSQSSDIHIYFMLAHGLPQDQNTISGQLFSSEEEIYKYMRHRGRQDTYVIKIQCSASDFLKYAVPQMAKKEHDEPVHAEGEINLKAIIQKDGRHAAFRKYSDLKSYNDATGEFSYNPLDGGSFQPQSARAKASQAASSSPIRTYFLLLSGSPEGKCRVEGRCFNSETELDVYMRIRPPLNMYILKIQCAESDLDDKKIAQQVAIDLDQVLAKEGRRAEFNKYMDAASFNPHTGDRIYKDLRASAQPATAHIHRKLGVTSPALPRVSFEDAMRNAEKAKEALSGLALTTLQKAEIILAHRTDLSFWAFLTENKEIAYTVAMDNPEAASKLLITRIAACLTTEQLANILKQHELNQTFIEKVASGQLDARASLLVLFSDQNLAENKHVRDLYNSSTTLQRLVNQAKAKQRPQPPITAAMTDHYAVLGVDPKASDEEIKKAYRKLMLQFHPDKAPEGQKEIYMERFRRIDEARVCLQDPAKRAVYDDYQAKIAARMRRQK